MQTVPDGWMFVGASLWDGGGHDHAPDDMPATEPAVIEKAVTEPAVTEKAAAEPAIEQEAPPEPVGAGAE
jgi:hypothetical protein